MSHYIVTYVTDDCKSFQRTEAVNPERAAQQVMDEVEGAFLRVYPLMPDPDGDLLYWEPDL